MPGAQDRIVAIIAKRVGFDIIYGSGSLLSQR